MTEQKALAKLGAKDWRSLNKKQIMKFLFEEGPNLSEDVRLKILETAPDILCTAQDVLAKSQETANKALEHNHDMAKAYVTCCHDLEDTLRKLMSDESASFEERKFWSSQLFALLQEMREFDKDNKNFLLKALTFIGTLGVVVIGGVLVVVTGGKVNLLRR